MIFTAFSGGQGRDVEWKRTLAVHSAWIGLEARLWEYALASGGSLTCAWLARTDVPAPRIKPDSPSRIFLETSGGTSAAGPNIRLEADLATGAFSGEIPPATPEQLCYVRDGRGTALSNDARLLARWVGRDLDPGGVYALLEFRAIPSPRTIFRQVRRLPAGHRFSLTPGRQPELEPVFLPGIAKMDGDEGSVSEETIVRLLDASLDDLPDHTALYFSGGVDSGLLAARLAASGRTDVRLLNYVFDADPVDGERARRMAAELGMETDHISAGEGGLSSVLTRIARDYSYPFGDISTLQMNRLVTAAVERGACSVIDGTGADGVFGVAGVAARWARIYRLPGWVRAFAGSNYRTFGIWRFDSPVESRLRKMSRSTRLDRDHAAIVAGASLNGTAYQAPPDIIESLAQDLHDFIRVLAKNLPDDGRMGLLDLVHVCGGRFAAKSYDPGRMNAVQTVYPYLHPDMIRAGFSSPARFKVDGNVKKAVLKKLLARQVPTDLVYSPKRSFSPPAEEIFRSGAVREMVEEQVLNPENPILSFCSERFLRKAVDRVYAGRSISPAAINFLWTVTFLTAWLAGQE